MNYYKIKMFSHDNNFNKIVEVNADTHIHAFNACLTIVPKNIKNIYMEILENSDIIKK